jgi:hypothetical protein
MVTVADWLLGVQSFPPNDTVPLLLMTANTPPVIVHTAPVCTVTGEVEGDPETM